MRALTGLTRRVKSGVAENLSLILLFMAMTGAQTLVPVGNPVGRDDLLPWMMVTLSIATFLRGFPIGGTHHPQLTRQHTRTGAFMRSIAMLLVPLACLFWHDATFLSEPLYLAIAAAVTLGTPVMLAMARHEGRTAWSPPGPKGIMRWVLFLFALPLFCLALGFVGQLGIPIISEVTVPSILVGLVFVVTATIARRPQDARQRRAAGRKDGQAWTPDRFPVLLAFLGPGFGMALLILLFKVLGDMVRPLDFTQAFIGVAHVCVWAAVIWPRPVAVARACLLWEVVPTGGSDKTTDGEAVGFEKPTEGALRFNPNKTRRINLVHAWVVPVREARIGDLDDPIRDLWPKRAPFVPQHVLGEASFEPDPITLQTQDKEITVRLQSGQDVQQLDAGDVQTRRLVILRAYVPMKLRRSKRKATYRWDQKVPEGTMQILDASVDTATLQNGDILISSSEGVARAYEIEIGAPIYSRYEAEAFRPPQLEDYVKV